MAKKAAVAEREKIEVENVNVPRHIVSVDAIKDMIMKKAVLETLPRAPGGLTQTEMRQAVVKHLPEEEFPGGAKADWWSKCVQLDLETEGIIKRDSSVKPFALVSGGLVAETELFLSLLNIPRP